MKKRLLATILVLCMVLGMLPGTTWAAEAEGGTNVPDEQQDTFALEEAAEPVELADPPTSGACGENLTWTYEADPNEWGYDQGGTLTISGTGAMWDFTRENGAPWYSRSSSIKEIRIEDGVTAIGNYAFGFCRNLTSVTIPESVTTIGNYAFQYCDLTNVTIPDSVTSIGDYAFNTCSKLTKITIPNSVTSIGRRAFISCYDLTNVTIPKSVTTFGYGVFQSCRSITNVTISNGVTSIGDSMFSDCSNLASVTIPDSVTNIGAGAFSGCGLTSIFIPASVIRMDGLGGFSGCPQLTSFDVDANNRQYSSQDGLLFNKEKSELLCCPRGKTSCIIPESVTTIGDSAFYSCNNLTSVTIPNSVTNIGWSAFSGCGLTSIFIPGSVTTLGNAAFGDCTALTNVTILNGVTRIGSSMFSDCPKLESIAIPASIERIDRDAFKNCVGLKTITYSGTETQWGQIKISDGNQELSLAELICTGTGPEDPDVPTAPGTISMSVTDGGLGKKLTARVTGGHWLTVQTRRAGSISLSSIQAPGYGNVSVTFSAAAGSTVQVWETEGEMTFSQGIPSTPILNTATKTL